MICSIKLLRLQPKESRMIFISKIVTVYYYSQAIQLILALNLKLNDISKKIMKKWDVTLIADI